MKFGWCAHSRGRLAVMFGFRHLKTRQLRLPADSNAPPRLRRSPLALVPVAFLTLACGSPLGHPLNDAADQTELRVSQQSAPAAAPPEGRSATPQQAKPVEPTLRYGCKEPLPKSPGSVRLATYNVENLFDDHDDPSISGDIDDKTMTTPTSRLRAIADTIKRLDADVLALQEIESKAALLQFRDGYLQGLGYDHVASVDAGDGRGIEQAVLSRVPITNVVNWPREAIADMDAKRTGDGWSKLAADAMPKRWARSPLMVDLRTKDGYELTLFVVHHKAGGRQFDAQRELEALQVVELATARLAKEPQRNLAVIGDFNATPTRKSIRVYFDAGFKNAYDKRFDRKASAAMYLTHITNRPIDFIFMSAGLDADTIDNSFFVLGTPLPPSDASEDIEVAGYASDHLPVAIDLHPKD